jgi:hypothetical protein
MPAAAKGLVQSHMICKQTIGTGMSKIRLWRSTDDFLVRKSGRGGVLKYKAQLP